MPKPRKEKMKKKESTVETKTKKPTKSPAKTKTKAKVTKAKEKKTFKNCGIMCPQCGKTFQGQRNLHVHMSMMHRYWHIPNAEEEEPASWSDLD